MNDTAQRRAAIREALNRFTDGDLAENARNLLNTLGYRSERVLTLEPNTAEAFIDAFDPEGELNRDRALVTEWASIDPLFQLTGEDLAHTDVDGWLFDPSQTQVDNTIIESYVFFALRLRGNTYNRTQLSQITREINKLFPMPAMLLFQHGETLTLSIINRRLGIRDQSRDVLEKVTLIKDINFSYPHRAHIDILYDLSLEPLNQIHGVHNFVELHRAWATTLDTEELNKKFYRELFNWFEWAVVEANFPTNENRTLTPEEHIIRLITRLLFVWFIKEKGLVADELFNETRIRDLLEDYDRDTGDSYYRAVLQNLFFATLNTEIGKRDFSQGGNPRHRNFSLYRYRDQITEPDELLALFAQTPFINGGLFDCLDSEEATEDGGCRIDCFSDEHYDLLSIPNRLFFDDNLGLIPLLEHYKFTVEENTPIEQDVALDPELLGKVFENLLAAYNPETGATARKQTGSYYTPRAIVDYMVEEALVATLVEQVSPTDGDAKFWDERLHYLLDYAQAFDDASEWFDDDETDGIVRTISELKILDPAVGSGAFPMGVLHKLTLALRRLDPNNNRWEQLQRDLAGQRAAEVFDEKDDQTRPDELLEIDETFKQYRDSDFGRKLYLIQNSVFGVDIQPVACQIAKLRFFISLAIEQEPTTEVCSNFGIKPLPNLETRFIAANTLIGLKDERTLTSAKARDLERELGENRERHFHATTRPQKLACKREDRKLRRALAKELKDIGMPPDDAEKIAHWDPYDQNAHADWFDPEWMFGVSDGFDVVIGNPPYAKGERMNSTLRKQLKESYGWAGDLYDYFIFAGFNLVSEKKVFSYIANDSYVALPTKRRIRELFLQNQLLRLVKAPAQTFEASIYTAIFILLKCEANRSHAYMSGEMNLPDFQYRSNGSVEYKMIDGMPDQKFLLNGTNTWVSRFLTFDNMEKVCRVLDTGIDSGNVRSKIFFKENDGNGHRLLQGRQIQRFTLQWDSPAAKYRFCDIDYEPIPIPGIGRGGKPSLRNEYWTFRGDIENHHQPERLLMRQTDDDLVAAYHSEEEAGRFYTDNTLFTVLPNSQKTDLKYLLALFNSALLNFIYHFLSQEQGKSQAQVKISVVNKLPVVIPAEEQQRPIIALVDQILSAKAGNSDEDTVALEKEINRRIYELYDLTSKEVCTVENWVNKLP